MTSRRRLNLSTTPPDEPQDKTEDDELPEIIARVSRLFPGAPTEPPPEPPPPPPPKTPPPEKPHRTPPARPLWLKIHPAIVRDPRLGIHAALTYAGILHMASRDHNRCDASFNALAELTGQKRRATINHVRALELAGAIRITRRTVRKGILNLPSIIDLVADWTPDPPARAE